MQRAVGEYLRTPNDGEIGSDAGGGASHLGRGSSQGKAPHSHQFVGEEAPLCIDLAVLQDEASLYYGGRQRFNFTVQAQRCERAGEVLGERHPTAKTPLTTRRKNRS
jgi:hypothetical protein